ncbi:AraC family transcriptional regulator [Roseobacter sp. A03A-229]
MFDPLSDIVRALNLSGAVFLNAEFTAPWAITAHVTEEDCRPFMPIPRQVIAYHVVIEGDILLSMDDGPGYRQHHRAKPGDVIFLPGNAKHVLASSTGQLPLVSDDLILPEGADGLVQVRHHGGGAPARMLCGFMASHAGSTPLFDLLPDVLIISIESLAKRRWVEASAIMAATEFVQGQLSHGRAASGLCELLLTEALCAYIEQTEQPPGWLGGMTHPRVAKALSRIHGALDRPLCVEALAAEVNMSRSAFVNRFTEIMGMGPRRYILMQRMQQALLLLQDQQMTIAEIATRVGYDAPEAFSRAFKRVHGLAPAQWRAAA